MALVCPENPCTKQQFVREKVEKFHTDHFKQNVSSISPHGEFSQQQFLHDHKLGTRTAMFATKQNLLQPSCSSVDQPGPGRAQSLSENKEHRAKNNAFAPVIIVLFWSRIELVRLCEMANVSLFSLHTRSRISVLFFRQNTSGAADDRMSEADAADRRYGHVSSHNKLRSSEDPAEPENELMRSQGMKNINVTLGASNFPQSRWRSCNNKLGVGVMERKTSSG